MPELAIVMSPDQSQPLPELVSVVADELRRQGVPCSLHESFPPPRIGLVYLLVSPPDFVRTRGQSALPDDAVLHRTVCLCAEDPEKLSADSGLAVLRAAGAVFDISQRAVTIMHRYGIPARLLRPGYVRSLDHYDPAAHRSVDVVFYGTRSDRRVAELAGAANVLARHVCAIHLAEPGDHPGDSPAWLTAARWPLLARAKIVINLHRGADAEVEWLRMLDAFHCGAVFATEHAYGMAPFVAGTHLLVGSAETLPQIVDAALRDEPALIKMRESALERLRGWLPLEASVSILRAAIVELVGRPIPADARLGVPGDVAEVGVRSADGNEELDAVRGELRDARVELAGLRQQLSRRRSPSRHGQPPTQLVRSNSAWTVRRGSSVSILFAVPEVGGAVLPTLDSVAASRGRNLELIVVASPATLVDGQIHRWLREHPRLASTLLISGSEDGRGAARNLGINFVRAEYCLVLDPGQILHPRAVAELLSALSGSPEAGFVYPMQVVSGDATELRRRGVEPLLSIAAWELRHQSAIQVPALVRTEVLREAGGYTVDPALAGSEDSDLWRRIAQRGGQGRLVPQILARRGFEDALAAAHTMKSAVGAG